MSLFDVRVKTAIYTGVGALLLSILPLTHAEEEQGRTPTFAEREVAGSNQTVTTAPSKLAEQVAQEAKMLSPKEATKKKASETSVEQKTKKVATQPAPEKVKHADPLLNKVEEAIGYSKRRFLTGGVHTPWQIMHGILAFRHDYTILVSREVKEQINAVEFISQDPVYQGEHWFEKTEHGGRAHVFSVPYAFEGHPNQFAAIMTMADLPVEHEFKTADGPITMGDIVKNAQMDVNSREGTTWTLWFLTHYLSSDTEWKNKSGENWSIERLVQIQNRAVVERSACGGCHNLFALSLARNNHLREGGELRGVWLEANHKIQRYIETARKTQNRDGSFSADYFRSRKFSQEFKKRLATSGHILEFLMAALPQQRLRERWVRNAVNNVANDLIRYRSAPADVGALYHAVDSLVIYRERVLPKESKSSEIKITGAQGEE